MNLFARADDPGLQAWEALMASAASLSRQHAGLALLSLDIGGETTSSALGLDGKLIAWGCHYIGTRHFSFEPGSYRVASMTRLGQILLDCLGIRGRVGQPLSASDRQRLLQWQVAALEAVALGRRAFFSDKPGRLHQKLPFELPPGLPAPAIVFAGGVGALIYPHLAGAPWPDGTATGDLRVDLAQAILASPVLSRSLHQRPEPANPAPQGRLGPSSPASRSTPASAPFGLATR